MSIITHDNFDASNIIISMDEKKLVYSNDSYQFKKIYIKYKYSNDCIDNLYVQIPEVSSYGVKTFANPNGDPSHSFSFSLKVKPNAEENIDEEKAEQMTTNLINIFNSIENVIKRFLKDPVTVRKLGKHSARNWDGFVESIKSVVSYQTDKETGARMDVPPTLFVKLKTEIGKKNPGIRTIFNMYNPVEEIIEELNSNDAIEKLQCRRCSAIGVVLVESIFIPKLSPISVQYKLHEVLITEINKADVSRLVIPNRLKKKEKVTSIINQYENDSSSDEQ